MRSPSTASRYHTGRLLATLMLLAGIAAYSGCDDALSQGNGQAADANQDTGAEQEAAVSGQALRDRIDASVDFTLLRHMDSSQQGAWQILHGVLAYGPDLRIRHEDKLVRAVDVISQGGMINGFLLRPTEHGLDSIVQPGSGYGQGHDDQWLAELAQGNLDLDYVIRWGEKDYTLRDLYNQARFDLNENSEATWTLMALATFEPNIDSEWETSDGTKWNFPRLVELEASREINDPELSACGGTHRLVGLSLAVNRYLAENPGAKLTGPWAKADGKIQEAISKAREYQQSDGAFSGMYFARPAEAPNPVERIGTTGHTLEFLCFAMSEKQIAEPWVAKAANHICELLEATKDEAVECGALYHAIHGLQMYRYRMWGERDFSEESGN